MLFYHYSLHFIDFCCFLACANISCSLELYNPLFGSVLLVQKSLLTDIINHWFPSIVRSAALNVTQLFGWHFYCRKLRESDLPCARRDRCQSDRKSMLRRRACATCEGVPSRLSNRTQRAESLCFAELVVKRVDLQSNCKKIISNRSERIVIWYLSTCGMRCFSARFCNHSACAQICKRLGNRFVSTQVWESLRRNRNLLTTRGINILLKNAWNEKSNNILET